MKILVIEDEPQLLDNIRESLLRENYLVETASDHASAIEKVGMYAYDCILLDIMLPNGSGLDVLRELKTLGRAGNVIIISAKWILPLLKAKFFTDDYSHLKEHPLLKGMLIVSSMYVAFSIGANNVANAAAPIASLTANEVGQNSISNFLPVIILSVLIVAPCFAIGSSLLGHKVTEANGKEIVDVNPFYATIIATLVASLLLAASLFKGIPTSLVQLNGAAFIALSIRKHGWKKTFGNATVKRFFTVWGIAPVFAFMLTYFLTDLLNPL